LISEWRRLWSERSKTDPEFPFGFVQLASFRVDYLDVKFPEIRWHQTADQGYVPNEKMPVKWSNKKKEEVIYFIIF